MKYMVMECHPSYAVVLDEEGQFRKVANLHYQVGQTVTDVVEMVVPEPRSTVQKKKTVRWITSLAAAAACLILILTSVFMGQKPYASVYMTINPEVRIDVNRKDIVVGLDGVNEDGKQLIAGYDYHKKDLDLVVDELVDRAIEMGFLHEGGQVTLALDATDNQWVVTHSTTLDTQLHDYLMDKLEVTIAVIEKKVESAGDSDYGDTDYDQIGETELPTTQPTSGGTADDPTAGRSDYNDTNYGESDYDNDDVDDDDIDDDDDMHDIDDDDDEDEDEESPVMPTSSRSDYEDTFVDGQTDYDEYEPDAPDDDIDDNDDEADDDDDEDDDDDDEDDDEADEDDDEADEDDDEDDDEDEDEDEDD